MQSIKTGSSHSSFTQVGVQDDKSYISGESEWRLSSAGRSAVSSTSSYVDVEPSSLAKPDFNAQDVRVIIRQGFQDMHQSQMDSLKKMLFIIDDEALVKMFASGKFEDVSGKVNLSQEQTSGQHINNKGGAIHVVTSTRGDEHKNKLNFVTFNLDKKNSTKKYTVALLSNHPINLDRADDFQGIALIDFKPKKSNNKKIKTSFCCAVAGKDTVSSSGEKLDTIKFLVSDRKGTRFYKKDKTIVKLSNIQINLDGTSVAKTQDGILKTIISSEGNKETTQGSWSQNGKGVWGFYHDGVWENDGFELSADKDKDHRVMIEGMGNLQIDEKYFDSKGTSK